MKIQKKNVFIPLRSNSLVFICAVRNFANVSFHSSFLCFSCCISATWQLAEWCLVNSLFTALTSLWIKDTSVVCSVFYRTKCPHRHTVAHFKIKLWEYERAHTNVCVSACTVCMCVYLRTWKTVGIIIRCKCVWVLGCVGEWVVSMCSAEAPMDQPVLCSSLYALWWSGAWASGRALYFPAQTDGLSWSRSGTHHCSKKRSLHASERQRNQLAGYFVELH